LGMTIEGVVYNELRAGPAGDGTPVERFRRTRIPRSRAAIEQVGRQLALEALDMVDPQVRVYPRPSEDHCPGCPFRAPCLAMTEGIDPPPVLDALCGRRADPTRERPRFSPGMSRGSSLPPAGGKGALH